MKCQKAIKFLLLLLLQKKIKIIIIIFKITYPKTNKSHPFSRKWRVKLCISVLLFFSPPSLFPPFICNEYLFVSSHPLPPHPSITHHKYKYIQTNTQTHTHSLTKCFFKNFSLIFFSFFFLFLFPPNSI